MAERSFKQEVEKLRLGAGEEFRGEGILAVTKALLQAGVSYVAGLPGRAGLAPDGRAGRRQ
jgi:indolepyruvate ferredoxin oxidoreductase alpha subunit